MQQISVELMRIVRELFNGANDFSDVLAVCVQCVRVCAQW
jgi:hypothetical protein